MHRLDKLIQLSRWFDEIPWCKWKQEHSEWGDAGAAIQMSDVELDMARLETWRVYYNYKRGNSLDFDPSSNSITLGSDPSNHSPNPCGSTTSKRKQMKFDNSHVETVFYGCILFCMGIAIASSMLVFATLLG